LGIVLSGVLFLFSFAFFRVF